ncbi:unnamed protein product, partial [Heterotrigona itama]
YTEYYNLNKNVIIAWISSHQNITGNEMVRNGYLNAKEASTLPLNESQTPIPYQELIY